jgi:hypothetical protein
VNVGTSVVLELKLEDVKDCVVEGAVSEEELSEELGVAVFVVLVLTLDHELVVTLIDVEDSLVELSDVLDGVEEDDEDFVVELTGIDDEVSEELERLELEEEVALKLDDVAEVVGVSVVVTLEDDSELELGEDDDDKLSEEEEDDEADLDVIGTLELDESIVDEAELSDSDVELNDVTEDEDLEVTVIVVIVTTSVDVEPELVGDGVFFVELDSDSDEEDSVEVVRGVSVLLDEDVLDVLDELEDELFFVDENEDLVGVDVAVDVTGVP